MTVKEASSSSQQSSTGRSQVTSVYSGRVGNAQRPKSVQQWSVVDVQKWLRRHCGDYYHLYCEAFLDQDVTGRCLVRMNENSLLRLGIIHPDHRQFIWREIGKLRLRSSILHLRDHERRLATTNPQ